MPTELKWNTEVIKVKIEGKEYSIPLATSLKVKEVKALIKLTKKDQDEQLDGFIEFFKKYIPEQVIEDLPMSALNQLINAWSAANGDLGE